MIPLDLDDTIAAIASPPGPGVRGIVRVSGPAALTLASERFEHDGSVLTDSTRPKMLSGQLRVDGLRPTLPALLTLWPAPKTYTGQDLAEVHTVGSPPLLDLVLADLLARGARRAEPGEFTLRAFLSGRIDLTRAEAVLGVIDAPNPSALDAALRQLAGGLATPIERLRDRLLDVLAHLEAGLDFVDEADVDPLGRAALAVELDEAAAEVEALASRMSDRDRPETRPRVVLVGPPNAGKSRLFNALIGGGQALVSDQAGTTRDYLSARCACDGLEVELIDTAGIEAASGEIESRAQALRDEQAARADLVLVCHAPDVTPLDQVSDRPRLDVATKADLGISRGLVTSSATGMGLDTLRSAIASALRSQLADTDVLASTGARCRDSLLGAGRALRNASGCLMLGGGEDLVAVDLRLAVESLGQVVGDVAPDEVLDRIFRRFCIGK